MKFSNNFYFILGILFSIDFVYSLFAMRVTHEVFFWDVNIWIYRSYRFVLALLFVKLYFKQREIESKNQ